MSLIQNPEMSNGMHVISASDGKNVAKIDGQRLIKIPEKREGKGKGKTIAVVQIPQISYPLGEDAELSVRPMMLELLAELQDEIIIAKQRTGATNILDDEINVPACVAWWAQKSFTAETVGNWFDGEMSELLRAMICAAKGWPENLTEDQEKFLAEKNAAYRASYCECASKFPKLNPSQMAELLRVLDAAEMTGPVVYRIRDKITPKDVSSSLGF